MLEIIDETRQFPHLEALEQILGDYLREIAVTQIVTLVLCDDGMIRELNRAHRDEDSATDVLAYPLYESEDATLPLVEQLGDVFISVDTAAKQAVTHQHGTTEEVLVLAAHGITHLRGFDHETEEAWRVFHQAQARVLEMYRNP